MFVGQATIAGKLREIQPAARLLRVVALDTALLQHRRDALAEEPLVCLDGRGEQQKQGKLLFVSSEQKNL